MKVLNPLPRLITLSDLIVACFPIARLMPSSAELGDVNDRYAGQGEFGVFEGMRIELLDQVEDLRCNIIRVGRGCWVVGMPAAARVGVASAAIEGGRKYLCPLVLGFAS